MPRRTIMERVCANEHHDESPPAERKKPKASDQLDRLADLVASGEAPMPTDLEPDARCRLLENVARQRRARLVQYIARAIAWDIQGSREPD